MDGERAHASLEDQMAGERERADLCVQEAESLRETRAELDRKLEVLQRRLHREQDEWFTREQELLQRIDEVAEKNNKILQAERVSDRDIGNVPTGCVLPMEQI